MPFKMPQAGARRWRMSLVRIVAVALPFALLLPATSLAQESLNPPPWFSDGEAFIKNQGGSCEDHGIATVQSSSGTARDCGVTVNGRYSLCSGRRAGSMAEFSCIIRGEPYGECARGGFPPRTEQAWDRSKDELQLATLAECMGPPLPIVDILSSGSLAPVGDFIPVKLRVHRTVDCDTMLTLRYRTAGGKTVRRLRQRVRLRAGRQQLKFKLSAVARNSLARARGTIGSQLSGACTVVPAPGRKQIALDATLALRKASG